MTGLEKDTHTMAKPIVVRVVLKAPVACVSPSGKQASHARDRNLRGRTAVPPTAPQARLPKRGTKRKTKKNPLRKGLSSRRVKGKVGVKRWKPLPEFLD